MSRAITFLVVSLMLSALAACNTVQGVGRDIESVGKAGKDVLN